MGTKLRKSVLVTSLCAASVLASVSTASTTANCTDSVRETISTQKTDLKLDGLYALPETTPTKLVVFAHGYHNRSTSWQPHLLAAEDHGAIAVAMDYRGTGPSPDNVGMPLMAGAEDTIAAAQHFSNRCNIAEVYLMGVSMGGAVSGLALAESEDVFDVWIDVEGLTNLAETYVEASAVALTGHTYAKGAVDDINAETSGGDPVEIQRRTVVSRIGDIKASGLRSAIVVHAVNDGLVPYNQAVEMSGALAGVGIPTELYTVARRSEGETDTGDNPDRDDTTATGYVTGYVPESKTYLNELDGHGWEGSTTHQVMVTALNRLWDLVDDGRDVSVGFHPYLVDAGSTTP